MSTVFRVRLLWKTDWAVLCAFWAAQMGDLMYTPPFGGLSPSVYYQMLLQGQQPDPASFGLNSFGQNRPAPLSGQVSPPTPGFGQGIPPGFLPRYAPGFSAPNGGTVPQPGFAPAYGSPPAPTGYNPGPSPRPRRGPPRPVLPKDMTPDPADLRAFLAQSNNGPLDPSAPPPSPFPPRMTHLPRTFDEIPDNIADLPDMTIDDARNMDKDIYNEMFGGANPTLVPAWAAIERREREKKWAQEQQAQVEAAERQQQMAQAASTSPANASQGDDLNWFERKAQQAGELADEAYDYGREQAGDAYQYGRRRAGEAVDATFDMAGDAYDATVDAAGEAYDYASEQVDDLVDWGQETIDDVIYGFQSMSAQEKQQFILDILGVEEARRLLNDPASADLLSTGLFLASFTPWGKGIKVVRTLGKVRKLGKARKAQAGIKSTAPIRGQKGARFGKARTEQSRIEGRVLQDLGRTASAKAAAKFEKELVKATMFHGGLLGAGPELAGQIAADLRDDGKLGDSEYYNLKNLGVGFLGGLGQGLIPDTLYGPSGKARLGRAVTRGLLAAGEGALKDPAPGTTLLDSSGRHVTGWGSTGAGAALAGAIASPYGLEKEMTHVARMLLPYLWPALDADPIRKIPDALRWYADYSNRQLGLGEYAE